MASLKAWDSVERRMSQKKIFNYVPQSNGGQYDLNAYDVQYFNEARCIREKIVCHRILLSITSLEFHLWNLQGYFNLGTYLPFSLENLEVCEKLLKGANPGPGLRKFNSLAAGLKLCGSHVAFVCCCCYFLFVVTVVVVFFYTTECYFLSGPEKHSNHQMIYTIVNKEPIRHITNLKSHFNTPLDSCTAFQYEIISYHSWVHMNALSHNIITKWNLD